MCPKKVLWVLAVFPRFLTPKEEMAEMEGAGLHILD